MLSHVEESKEHEELPIKEDEYPTILQCFVGLLWITSVFLAQELIIAIGDIIDDIQDKCDTLDDDHDINIVQVLFVEVEDTERSIFGQIELLLSVELVITEHCFELTQTS